MIISAHRSPLLAGGNKKSLTLFGIKFHRSSTNKNLFLIVRGWKTWTLLCENRNWLFGKIEILSCFWFESKLNRTGKTLILLKKYLLSADCRITFGYWGRDGTRMGGFLFLLNWVMTSKGIKRTNFHTLTHFHSETPRGELETPFKSIRNRFSCSIEENCWTQ